jgi:hypothetical protein
MLYKVLLISGGGEGDNVPNAPSREWAESVSEMAFRVVYAARTHLAWTADHSPLFAADIPRLLSSLHLAP